MTRKVHKLWVLRLLKTVFTLVFAVAMVNYLVDPLWCFGHSFSWNQRQAGFDERLQKANLLTFGGGDYNALLLGSSRTTVIPAEFFTGMNVFNLSVSSMMPIEYNEFIEFAKGQLGHDFDTIVLGIDFYGTNANFRKNENKSADYYFKKINAPLYRWTSLLSTDLLGRSYRNLKNNYKSLDMYYDRENHHVFEKVTAEERTSRTKAQLTFYKDNLYGEDYQAADIYSMFEQLKKNNPNTKFIVYTTPPSVELWRLLLDEGRLPDYQQFISDSVHVFGSVVDFMGINSVSTNPNNYMDAHHFYKETGGDIVRRLLESDLEGVPEDFGRLVTQESLAGYLLQVAEENHFE